MVVRSTYVSVVLIKNFRDFKIKAFDQKIFFRAQIQYLLVNDLRSLLPSPHGIRAAIRLEA